VEYRNGLCLTSVTDSGIGIPPDKQELLFTKFVQADSSQFGGTGLGLAISKQLAELMGGSVGLRSAVGTGSTFWVELPLPAATDPTTADLTATDLDRLPAVHQPRSLVLVADDNLINRKIAAAILRNLGYDVDLAVDGQDALRCWDQRPYAAILLDCQMPEIDGYEVARRIRAAGGRGSGIPIIAMTASSGSGERQICLAAGMSDFVPKPFEVDDLKRALKAAPQVVS
jgi:CheY-like chemotaxis protein